MRSPKRETPAPADTGHGGKGKERCACSGKNYSTGISDAQLADYLNERRSRVWSLVARGEIPQPDADNGIIMSWTPASFGRIQRDIAAGRVFI